jgi:CII-binding regulator of phage lambda lysogenization HflD
MNWEDMTLDDQLADIGRRLASMDEHFTHMRDVIEQSGQEMARLYAEMTETLNKSLEVSHGTMD